MFHAGLEIRWRSTLPLRSGKARSERLASERAFFFNRRTSCPHGAAGRGRFARSVRKRTATAAAPWRFCGMSPTMSQPQVQKGLALRPRLDRLWADAAVEIV